MSVRKERESWYFSLPSRKGTHHETGNPVRYPAIVFTDREKHRQFMDAIREKGRVFIEQRLVDMERPIIFFQKQQNESKQGGASKAQNNPTESKKTVPIEKPKLNSSIAVKEWRDPPPLTARPQARSVSKFARR